MSKWPTTLSAIARYGCDQVAIIGTIARMAQAQDNFDSEAYLACCADTVRLAAAVSFPDCTPRSLSATELRDMLFEAASGYDGCHHMVTNHRVDIDGDEAVCVADLHCTCWMVEAGTQRHATLGGSYTFGLRRIDGEWRIYERATRIRYVLGDSIVPKRAAARIAARNQKGLGE